MVGLQSQTDRFVNNQTFDRTQVLLENPTKNDLINMLVYVTSRSKYLTYANAITRFSNNSIFIIIPNFYDILNHESQNSLEFMYMIYRGLNCWIYQVLIK